MIIGIIVCSGFSMGYVVGLNAAYGDKPQVWIEENGNHSLFFCG